MKPFEFQKPDRTRRPAAILSSFFIGLGQAYNGEIAKAVIFLILYAISIFLTFFLIASSRYPSSGYGAWLTPTGRHRELIRWALQGIAVECFAFGFGDECSSKGIREGKKVPY